MLLRNLSPVNGLCNGTRLIIKKCHTYLIEAVIANGKHKGQIAIIPKMQLSPSSGSAPIDFIRKQFPIRPSFAMSINKSQGQTLDKIESVFSHGQVKLFISYLFVFLFIY